MTYEEVSRILRHTYDGAPFGKKVPAALPFGVQYGRDIMASGLTTVEIAREAGLRKWGPTERGGEAVGVCGVEGRIEWLR